MTANPYESPNLSPLAIDPAEEVQSRTPWLVAPSGLFLGAVIGGVAGGCGSAMLGFAASLTEVLSGRVAGTPSTFQMVIGVLVIGLCGGIIGAVLGVICGSAIGFVLALVAAFRSKRFLNWLTLLVTLLSMLCGTGIGALGGAIFVHDLPGGLLWLAIGGGVGLVAGLGGGLMLGRGVATIAWAGRKPKEAEEKSLPERASSEESFSDESPAVA